MKLLEAEPHASLHCADRHVRDLSDLALAVAAVISELDRMALLNWKRAQRVADGVSFHGRRDAPPWVGVEGRVTNVFRTAKVDLAATMRRAPAQHVDRPIANHGAEPGADRAAARIEARCSVPD